AIAGKTAGNRAAGNDREIGTEEADAGGAGRADVTAPRSSGAPSSGVAAGDGSAVGDGEAAAASPQADTTVAAPPAVTPERAPAPFTPRATLARREVERLFHGPGEAPPPPRRPPPPPPPPPAAASAAVTSRTTRGIRVKGSGIGISGNTAAAAGAAARDRGVC